MRITLNCLHYIHAEIKSGLCIKDVNVVIQNGPRKSNPPSVLHVSLLLY